MNSKLSFINYQTFVFPWFASKAEATMEKTVSPFNMIRWSFSFLHTASPLLRERLNFPLFFFFAF
jgi:hypothetical protein